MVLMSLYIIGRWSVNMIILPPKIGTFRVGLKKQNVIFLANSYNDFNLIPAIYADFRHKEKYCTQQVAR
jgi:hypothetical protein